MRIDGTNPAELSTEQHALYQRFVTGPRASDDSPFRLVDAQGRLQGPPAVWILSPPLGEALQQLGGTVRFGLQLPVRAREIAILLVGHHHQSAFELYAHRLAGAAAGLNDADQAALAEGRAPDGLSDVERAVFDTTRRVLATGTLDDAEYQHAIAVLGEANLFELITIIGFYTMVALQLAVFDVRPTVTA